MDSPFNTKKKEEFNPKRDGSLLYWLPSANEY